MRRLIIALVAVDLATELANLHRRQQAQRRRELDAQADAQAFALAVVEQFHGLGACKATFSPGPDSTIRIDLEEMSRP